MNKRLSKVAIILSLTLFTVFSPVAQTRRTQPPTAFDRAQYEIKSKKFVLDNGLTLLVHTDTSVPIVAVNSWYHVGS